jgi:periplasmic divalent cation tolerance protein
MKAREAAVILVTTPDLKTARRLARAVLAARLAACANLVPKIESHYWWQGKIETGREVLVLFKTTGARLAALEKLVAAEHPYETPEFLVLAIERGSRRYLAWLKESVARKG